MCGPQLLASPTSQTTSELGVSSLHPRQKELGSFAVAHDTPPVQKEGKSPPHPPSFWGWRTLGTFRLLLLTSNILSLRSQHRMESPLIIFSLESKSTQKRKKKSSSQHMVSACIPNSPTASSHVYITSYPLMLAARRVREITQIACCTTTGAPGRTLPWLPLPHSQL